MFAVYWTFMMVFLAAALFVPAGRLDLPWFWAYLLTLPAIALVIGRKVDPGLIRERMRPAPGGVDRNLRWQAGALLLLHLIVAGLDARFGWSGTIGWPLRLAGYVGFLAALVLAAWAMTVNRFFSPVVRIQSERGHQVITSGPYAWMRHPGYAASALGFLWDGMMLGSWWSLLPMLPLVLLILRRTALEDAFLTRELPGYADYAARVRWRLLPGVW